MTEPNITHLFPDGQPAAAAGRNLQLLQMDRMKIHMLSMELEMELMRFSKAYPPRPGYLWVMGEQGPVEVQVQKGACVEQPN